MVNFIIQVFSLLKEDISITNDTRNYKIDNYINNNFRQRLKDIVLDKSSFENFKNSKTMMNRVKKEIQKKYKEFEISDSEIKETIETIEKTINKNINVYDIHKSDKTISQTFKVNLDSDSIVETHGRQVIYNDVLKNVKKWQEKNKKIKKQKKNNLIEQCIKTQDIIEEKTEKECSAIRQSFVPTNKKKIKTRRRRIFDVIVKRKIFSKKRRLFLGRLTKIIFKPIVFVAKKIKNTVKKISSATIKLITNSMRKVLNISSKIIKKLGRGISNIFKYIVSTPQGMYILGFISGFLYERYFKHVIEKVQKWGSSVKQIIQSKEKLKQYYDNIIQNKTKRIEEMLGRIYDSMSRNQSGQETRLYDTIQLLKKARSGELSRDDIKLFAKKIIQDMQCDTWMIDMSEIVSGIMGSVVGGALGSTLGKVVGSVGGPLGGALGTVIGQMLGSQIGKVIAEIPSDKGITQRIKNFENESKQFMDEYISEYKLSKQRPASAIRSAFKPITDKDKKMQSIIETLTKNNSQNADVEYISKIENGLLKDQQSMDKGEYVKTEIPFKINGKEHNTYYHENDRATKNIARFRYQLIKNVLEKYKQNLISRAELENVINNSIVYNKDNNMIFNNNIVGKHGLYTTKTVNYSGGMGFSNMSQSYVSKETDIDKINKNLSTQDEDFERSERYISEERVKESRDRNEKIRNMLGSIDYGEENREWLKTNFEDYLNKKYNISELSNFTETQMKVIYDDFYKTVKPHLKNVMKIHNGATLDEKHIRIDKKDSNVKRELDNLQKISEDNEKLKRESKDKQHQEQQKHEEFIKETKKSVNKDNKEIQQNISELQNRLQKKQPQVIIGQYEKPVNRASVDSN